jgi:hypothetical protein
MTIWDTFTEIVTLHFGYLETHYSFKKVSMTVPFIVYESFFLRIRIFLNQQRSELTLNISSLDDPQNKGGGFDLDSLIGIRGNGLERKGIFPIYDFEHLNIAVQEMAQLLQRYGSDLLGGDLNELERLKKLGVDEVRRMYPKH